VLSRYATTAAVLVAAVLCAAAPAAAKRDVGPRFYGVNWDADIRNRAPQDLQDAEWGRMRPAGVESTRTMFSWNDAQFRSAQTTDFSKIDAVVARAASNRVDLLPIVMETPRWARQNPDSFHSPPKNPDDYSAFLTALVGRYGPNGAFWAEHPELPKTPLRTWQIWNEPHLQYQWNIDNGVDYAPGYGQLLRAAYTTLKQADPGSTVVMAGQANKSWEYLDHLYKAGGIKGYFDVGAVHPYTATPRGVVSIAQRFRAVMRKHGDGRKPLWVTELGLPASEGKGQGSNTLQTTDRGMATFLTQSYEKLIAKQRSRDVRVSRIYWYSWASTYCCGDIFRFSGLRTYDPSSNTVAAKPAFAAYTRSARKHQR
jgi:hypothetical protein